MSGTGNKNATAATTAADMLGFRLILSDSSIQGGQIFRSFPNQRLISREQIVGLLKEHFGFDELCRQRGIGEADAESASGLQIVGFDGRRRIPIQNNEDVRSFSVSVQSTKFPTVEVHLGAGSAAAASQKLGSLAGASLTKSSQDRVEELEDMNKQLESSAERVLRRVDDLERMRLGDRDEMQRIINKATRELADLQKESIAPLTTELAELRQLMDSSVKDYTGVMRTIDTNEKAHRVSLKEVNKNMEDLTTRIQFQLAEMGADLSRLLQRQKSMGEEYDRLRDWINKHDEEIEKMTTTKLEVQRYEQEEAQRAEKWKKETTALVQAVKKVDKECQGKLDSLQKELSATIARHHAEHEAKLQESTSSLEAQLQKSASELDAMLKSSSAELASNIQGVDETLRSKIESGDAKIQELTTANHAEVMKKVAANHSAHAAKIDEHHMEARTKLDRLEVNSKQTLAAVHKDLSKRIDANHAQLASRADQSESVLGERITTVHTELQQRLATANTQLEQSVGENFKSLTEKIDADVGKVKDEAQAATAAVLSRLVAETKKIGEDYGARLDTVERTVVSKDIAINKKTDALTRKCETTFKDVHERMEEGMKAERTRLSSMEKMVQDSSGKIRHDFRSEVERLRRDYEQDAARLDGDLNDLHMKHDVVKQEINFFQSRLLEQKDWAQRQFMEAATATRLAQADSQEGLAASTKMLQALKDDVVGFREKMAQHISTLQNSTDGHRDAITEIDEHRSKARGDLDSLMADHKAYVEDMDGWADDVRLKIEKLYKAMEPCRAEWQIMRAMQRGKELKKPLALKSPTFNLQGLPQVQMEFFPNGHNHSPEGMCALRLLMPPGTQIRFECFVGRMTCGTNEFDSSAQGSGAKLSMDFFFDSWYDEIRSDGSLPIVFEVLADLSSEESALTRCVHLQSH
mmetsp:Transcript_58090/g.138189  ORF Transcript_58090/g.138189 Transcript_58090/m.138189 type:complete len:924 (-) Transcript_58090:60-2831(-)